MTYNKDKAAVMIPLPPAILRLSSIEQDRILSNKNYYPQIAHILEEKVDKIRLTDDQIKKLNILALQRFFVKLIILKIL
jgi:hypothetical protein